MRPPRGLSISAIIRNEIETVAEQKLLATSVQSYFYRNQPKPCKEW